MVQHHIVSGGWVPSFAGPFLLDAELAEATDQDIFPCPDGVFDDFNEVFHKGAASFSGIPNSFLNVIHDICLRKCHVDAPARYFQSLMFQGVRVKQLLFIWVFLMKIKSVTGVTHVFFTWASFWFFSLAL